MFKTNLKLVQSRFKIRFKQYPIYINIIGIEINDIVPSDNPLNAPIRVVTNPTKLNWANFLMGALFFICMLIALIVIVAIVICVIMYLNWYTSNTTRKKKRLLQKSL